MMPAASFLWWIRQIALILTGIGFLLFGIQVLISAYHLQDPFIFILTFFSSNFIILISAALLVGFVFQAIRFRHGKEAVAPSREGEESLMAVKDISKEELHQRLGGKGLTIIDIRANWSQSQRKIPGAVHEAAERVGDWAPRYDPEKPVVLYGVQPKDADSREVAAGLAAAGFSDVSVLTGGWHVWQAAEMPMEKRLQNPLPKGVLPEVGKP